jgi:hypothetical protein
MRDTGACDGNKFLDGLHQTILDLYQAYKRVVLEPVKAELLEGEGARDAGRAQE